MNKVSRKVLEGINDSVPKRWWSQLIRKEWANPVIRELVDRGLNDPEVTEDVREKLRTLKRSEEYSEQHDVINEDIEKKIDEFLTRKVRQATKEGRLPPLKKEDYDVRKLKEKSIKEENQGN
jgi:hypothetical protein